ncbi:MAG: peptidase S46 [Bacteroidetes bacterium GWF2_42_66]|nr:MAG: peptidase S46 [Bacteroidetes bacterium GWA2_42_15]OFX96288.1 MAG: peptidase S46 [Bacteroidetes bacterium GWE2_42_39]OFY46327.1 MAG: peptidase S46 [Bacteroidetes bacterium GWF2_42_66]
MSLAFTLAFTLVFIFVSGLFAKEGMWIPALLNKNIDEMQQMGFQLSAEDIYSVNHASMKDAVVIFGRGCTGGLISGEGLLITNHHCGYDAIQKHSSIEHDYLTDGFWAMSHEEELPNPGLSVKFLERMEDVTTQVLDGTAEMEEEKIQQKINENIKAIEEAASDSGRFNSIVKPLFYGNQYFLYVYLEYTDVRLVGAPPSAIGKFGGDTDNWMWPRHTGDFSVFRIYAGKDNQPADYSKDNVPYRSKKFFPVSVKGVQPEDFTMIFGFPGSTTQYLSSQAVSMIMGQSDPDRIKIRNKKLEILAARMEADRKIRIQYAAKYATISNSWKRWQGEILGLKRLDAVQKKQDFEADFTAWVSKSEERKDKYGKVLSEFEELYLLIGPYSKARDYYTEIVPNGCDVFRLASLLDRSDMAIENIDREKKELLKRKLLEELESHFKDFDQPTDEKIFTEMLRLYRNDLDKTFLPDDFTVLMDQTDNVRLKEKVYGKSVLIDQEKLAVLVGDMPDKGLKALKNDPVMKLYRLLKEHYDSTVSNVYTDLDGRILKNQKLYMEGILAMKENERVYPDANFTLRVGYGKVEGYEPRDGVHYDYYTTLDGIVEKDNPEIYDYNVPQKLRELYEQKDFGSYSVNGQVPVCFSASNHTTGGNSGSPVINARGELIGVNFDRCWEGTMSDIMFDPDRCRNIVLDIRYALFIIDKLAGAGYLLEEMKKNDE